MLLADASGAAMRRREFITLLGGAAAAWPLAARAQQTATPVIGFLAPGSAGSDAYRAAAFRQGLGEAGFVDGQNLKIEYRWAEDHYDRLRGLADDLVRRRVALIVSSSTPATLAAKAATATIPIVFEAASDPVKLGFVDSLSRPGRNITGVTQSAEEVLPKRFQLLHEVLPKARVLALLVNPTDPQAEPQTREARMAVTNLGLELQVLTARTEHELEVVFAKVAELGAGGIVIGGSAFFTSRGQQLAQIASQHAVPAIYQSRQFTAAGGLMSYGSSITESHRLVGIYAGRILKGEKPSELAVQQATKVELFINLKTAKALGINIPNTLIGRADEVIE
jgi:putative tryptophan/tyrosine transport system substrate-binding protein